MSDAVVKAVGLIARYTTETGRRPACLAFGVVAWRAFCGEARTLSVAMDPNINGSQIGGVPVRESRALPVDAIVVEEFAPIRQND